MQFVMNRLAKTILGMTFVELLVGCAPRIEKVGDLTEDGLQDILITDMNNRRYLFIGQTNGKYIRTIEEFNFNGKVKYFVTEDGKTAYFFDGKFYRKSQN